MLRTQTIRRTPTAQTSPPSSSCRERREGAVRTPPHEAVDDGSPDATGGDAAVGDTTDEDEDEADGDDVTEVPRASRRANLTLTTNLTSAKVRLG